MSLKAAFMVPHPPLIVSEIGRGSEKEVQKTIDSYEKVAKEIAELKPEAIIISSPHADIYADYFHALNSERLTGDFSRFGASNVSFDYKNDLELVNTMEEICAKEDFPGVLIDSNEGNLDHGVMVPLYFIKKYLKDFKLVVVSLSGLSYVDHYKMGQIIKKAIDSTNRNVVFVASGDLSHRQQEYGPYGFVKEGPIYDEKIMDICSKGEFLKLLEFDENLCEKAAECGHRSFIIMAGILDGIDVTSKYYSHENVTGVGYGICSYYPKGESDERKFLDKYFDNLNKKLKEKYKSSDEYVLLAKETINEYIKNNRIIEVPKNISNDLKNKRAGVFVSIHEFGELRGCIGTIIGVRNNVAEEIIHNAIEASTKDPRFPKITSDELEYLDINVDVLMPAEKVNSIDELDVKKYGVIVTSGYKRGLLLPDIDGVDTVEEQINIAKRKANINDNEKIEIEKFEVIRHK